MVRCHNHRRRHCAGEKCEARAGVAGRPDVFPDEGERPRRFHQFRRVAFDKQRERPAGDAAEIVVVVNLNRDGVGLPELKQLRRHFVGRRRTLFAFAERLAIDENPRPILDLAGRQPDLFALPTRWNENPFSIPGKPVVRLVAQTRIARTIGGVAGALRIVLCHSLAFPGFGRHKLLPACLVVLDPVPTALFTFVVGIRPEPPATGSRGRDRERPLRGIAVHQFGRVQPGKAVFRKFVRRLGD